jgi:hypothetical protein
MKKVLSSIPVVILLMICLLSSSCGRNAQEPIDLKGLRSSGDDWKVLEQDTLPDGGSIKLHQDKWLMYFLHWRPLSQEKENISTEYARSLMLSFWGPDMPFTLTENFGEIEIAGHKAYFVDGTIYEGAIHSRFIVWNCPETKRQLIADCNINLRRGTPEELLELQGEITRSVLCHHEAIVTVHASLTSEFVSEKYNLSFWIPENWRTHEFNDQEWFPNGLTHTNGSFWTLLTDSEKYVELRWDQRKKEISEELFNEYIKNIEKDSVVTQVTSKIDSCMVELIEAKPGYFAGEGRFEYTLRAGDQKITKPFRFKALLWNNHDKTYFLLASMVSLQEFWNMQVDLSPTDEIFEKFIQDEVLANTRVFNKEYFE